MMGPAPDGAALAVVPAFAERRCERCQLPLGANYWITSYPAGAHEACVDWTKKPFPFTRHVKALERIARAPEVQRPDLLRRAAFALAGLEDRWPGEALAVLERGRLIIAAARRFTADAPAKLRAQL